MGKEIYWVSGYIPDDEKVVYTTIRKLIKLGDNNGYKFIWINIDKDGGIGTALSLEKVGNDTIVGALLEPHKFYNKGEQNILREMTFDEMLEIRSKLIIKLKKELEEEKT